MGGVFRAVAIATCIAIGIECVVMLIKADAAERAAKRREDQCRK